MTTHKPKYAITDHAWRMTDPEHSDATCCGAPAGAHDPTVPAGQVGTKRGLPVYPTLIEIAEAEAADAYTEAGARFYRVMVQPTDEPTREDDAPARVAYYAPWKGGGCYEAARLLTDPRMRRAIRITANSRRRAAR